MKGIKGFQKGQVPWNKGKKMLFKTRPYQLGKIPKSAFKKGHIPWHKGIGHKPETKLKMTIINRLHARKGSDNPLWKGGSKISQRKTKQKYRTYYTIQEEIRRTKKIGNGGSFTLEEWENLKYACRYRCLACGRFEPEIKLTADHIIPVIKGGSSYIDNIQPLCQSCNSKKFDKIIKYATT